MWASATVFLRDQGEGEKLTIELPREEIWVWPPTVSFHWRSNFQPIRIRHYRSNSICPNPESRGNSKQSFAVRLSFCGSDTLTHDAPIRKQWLLLLSFSLHDECRITSTNQSQDPLFTEERNLFDWRVEALSFNHLPLNSLCRQDVPGIYLPSL